MFDSVCLGYVSEFWVFLLCKTANAEDLFGDADDISSVSSHGDREPAEADMVFLPQHFL